MSVSILPNAIKEIAVIDDDKRVREALADSVHDAGFKPIIQENRIGSLKELITQIMATAQFAICDHHLSPGNYANFDGAEAVAKLYSLKFPAILITRWSLADMDKIRPFRRNIPVMIKKGELEKTDIIYGIEQCLNEFKNIYSKERKPWRTLLRVIEVDTEFASVIIPSWNPELVIRIPKKQFSNIRKLKAGLRIFAETNLGVISSEDLYFDNFNLGK
jgi:CheY-like chemotaxis protein